MVDVHQSMIGCSSSLVYRHQCALRRLCPVLGGPVLGAPERIGVTEEQHREEARNRRGCLRHRVDVALGCDWFGNRRN